MKDSVRQNLTRPQRYWYIDGISEIAGGMVIFLIGAVNAIAALFPPGSVRILLINLVQPVLIITAALISRPIVHHFKERITYPRTGYVEYSGHGHSIRWQRFFLTFFIAFSISALVGLLGKSIPEQFWPAIIAAILALALAYLGARLGLSRFYIVAGLTFLIGALISALDLPISWPSALLFGLEGLIWIIGGMLVLVHYLKTTHPLDEAGDND